MLDTHRQLRICSGGSMRPLSIVAYWGVLLISLLCGHRQYNPPPVAIWQRSADESGWWLRLKLMDWSVTRCDIRVLLQLCTIYDKFWLDFAKQVRIRLFKSGNSKSSKLRSYTNFQPYCDIAPWCKLRLRKDGRELFATVFVTMICSKGVYTGVTPCVPIYAHKVYLASLV